MDGVSSQSFRVPGWLFGLVCFCVMCGSGVAWAYSTFVSIRERDLLRQSYDARITEMQSQINSRMDSIDRGQEQLSQKIDKVILLMANTK